MIPQIFESSKHKSIVTLFCQFRKHARKASVILIYLNKYRHYISEVYYRCISPKRRRIKANCRISRKDASTIDQIPVRASNSHRTAKRLCRMRLNLEDNSVRVGRTIGICFVGNLTEPLNRPLCFSAENLETFFFPFVATDRRISHFCEIFSLILNNVFEYLLIIYDNAS
jgi:hypothetical protein